MNISFKCNVKKRKVPLISEGTCSSKDREFFHNLLDEWLTNLNKFNSMENDQAELTFKKTPKMEKMKKCIIIKFPSKK